MDDKGTVTTSTENENNVIETTTDVEDTSPFNSSSIADVDYSPDDEDLDPVAAAAAAAAEATRDTLAEGLVANLLRPCVDRLDAAVQCTRLSQLDLKLQLDSLASELKHLSLLQHDYMYATNSSKLPVTTNTTSATATNTCTLLDGYARRLCGARAKIAVVGNILESTQERLRVLTHRINREHNNRRSLLEPQVVVTNVALENIEDKLEFGLEYEEEGEEAQSRDNNDQKMVDNSAVIATATEPSVS